MEERITLEDIFTILKKRIVLIAITTIVTVMITGIVSYFILTPVYQASTQLLVNQAEQSESQYSTNEVQTSLQLMNTYYVILQSPRILKLVIAELDLPVTVDELKDMISVSSEEDSQVLNLTVENEDAQLAVTIANTLAYLFKENVVDIMNVNNVEILAEAEMNDNLTPVFPQPILYILIALAAGIAVSVGIAVLIEYIDNTVKTENDIERHFGLPVLGVIPKTDSFK